METYVAETETQAQAHQAQAQPQVPATSVEAPATIVTVHASSIVSPDDGWYDAIAAALVHGYIEEGSDAYMCLVKQTPDYPNMDVVKRNIMPFLTAWIEYVQQNPDHRDYAW